MAEQNTQQQEPNQQGTAPQGAQGQTNYDEIFQKLDAILDRRSEGLAKSALKDNGIDESEISDIVKAYREQKQNKAQESANALDEANKTIAALTKQIADKTADDALTAAALDIGVDRKQLPYVLRLCEKEGLLAEDGTADAEKARAAITKLLEDVPALKSSEGKNEGFVSVGTKPNTSNSEEDADKKLRSYFGLK